MDRLLYLTPTSGRFRLPIISMHEGYILVLQGVLEVELANGTYELEAGDAIYLKSAVLCNLTARGELTVRYMALWDLRG